MITLRGETQGMDKIELGTTLAMYARSVDTAFSDFIDIAQMAEGLGYDGVYTNDHFFLPRTTSVGFSEEVDPDKPFHLDAWCALSAIAARTSRVRIGPQVASTAARLPAFIAKMSATIDLISNGRFVLQVGTGWHQAEHEAFGMPFEVEISQRYQRMIESIEIIRLLWSSDADVSYEGSTLTLRGAPFWPKPVQRPGPPIWIGGGGRRARDAVARYADGWLPAAGQFGGIAPARYGDYLREIKTSASNYGRPPEAITAGLYVWVAIDASRANAAQRAERLRQRAGWETLTPGDMQEKGLIVVGNPDDCYARIAQYAEAGARYITVGFLPVKSTKQIIEDMKLFWEEVGARLTA
jgi:probable F420-dependent oxidoreductase